MRLVPRWPVRTVASRLLLGLRRVQVQPCVRLVCFPCSMTASSLSVSLSCLVSWVMFPEYQDHVSHRALLCGLMQPRRIVPLFVDYEFSESFPPACPVSSALFLESLRAYRFVSRVALFFVLSDSQYCGIQFLVDAIGGVQGFVSTWRLMWPRTKVTASVTVSRLPDWNGHRATRDVRSNEGSTGLAGANGTMLVGIWKQQGCT